MILLPAAPSRSRSGGYDSSRMKILYSVSKGPAAPWSGEGHCFRIPQGCVCRQTCPHGSQGKVVVLVFQADPGFDLPETESIDESKAEKVRGYQNFMAAVIKETEQYSGQVLLVHGDTHFFKVDKPLYNSAKMLTNFTRLQTFGSPHLHWVKVTVDPASQNIFQIQPMMVR